MTTGFSSADVGVFPAPAGINRTSWNVIGLLMSVPRASGDKPRRKLWYVVTTECSPRQRG
ncbi:hypothetical protein HIY14_000185 [Salmonella enterica subsp. enterica serovar Montevideo]|nr:hypothetical protein [Salmonella enterica subsp. enterica serovar Montevideo]EFS2161313.1 hypothetical protein [Salmonella enterica subsp. enterica serovar Montevideo]EFS2238481.1 hypothetical protein [Salmonella enterica subsp. enterica serovar Montevideo]EFS2358528.1 hypothetical protein [Salmonella enterica subsp. enterica serovar Montevideo]EFZ9391355.1 hypothetical protein [Salmonella enterica subsp. enterica serovar Montevideo]